MRYYMYQENLSLFLENCHPKPFVIGKSIPHFSSPKSFLMRPFILNLSGVINSGMTYEVVFPSKRNLRGDNPLLSLLPMQIHRLLVPFHGSKFCFENLVLCFQLIHDFRFSSQFFPDSNQPQKASNYCASYFFLFHGDLKYSC